MLTDKDLQNIGDILEVKLEKLEQRLEQRLEQKLEQKLEHKLEEKLDQLARSIQQTFKEYTDKYDALILNHEQRLVHIETDIHLIKKAI